MTTPLQTIQERYKDTNKKAFEKGFVISEVQAPPDFKVLFTRHPAGTVSPAVQEETLSIATSEYVLAFANECVRQELILYTESLIKGEEGKIEEYVQSRDLLDFADARRLTLTCKIQAKQDTISTLKELLDNLQKS